MKAITVYQPYASLLACGAKQYETRSWATKYRGPIAIHAGMKDPLPTMRSLPSDIQKAMFDCLYKTFGIQSGAINKMPTGAIIATAELVGCWEMKDFQGMGFFKHGTFYKPTEDDLLFGDWDIDRYAWEFKNMKMLDEPVPARGKQRIWNWRNAVETNKELG